MMKSHYPEASYSLDSHIKELYGSQRDEAVRWLQIKYSLDLDSAIDVYQNAIVIYYDKLVTGHISISDGPCKPFLFGILKNKSLEHLRELKKYVTQDIVETTQEIDSVMEAQIVESQLSVVYECMHKLSAGSRRILSLFYFERKSIGTITKELGYKNEDTTKNMKYKSLRKLKTLISKSHGTADYTPDEDFARLDIRM